MNYDENVFKEKANIKARRIWLVFALLLTANYGSDAANGLYPVSNYIIFVVLCWVPFFIGDILLRLKGKSTDLYKYDPCYRIRYLLYLCILHNSFTNCIYLCASCYKPSGPLQEPQLYDSLRHRQYACHHRQRLIPRCRTWLQLCG